MISRAALASIFDTIDTDRDGKVSRGEINDALELLSYLDKNAIRHQLTQEDYTKEAFCSEIKSVLDDKQDTWRDYLGLLNYCLLAVLWMFPALAGLRDTIVAVGGVFNLIVLRLWKSFWPFALYVFPTVPVFLCPNLC